MIGGAANVSYLGRRIIPATMLLVATVVLGAACVHTAFTPTTGVQLPTRPEGCYLDMIFHGPPPYPML